MFPIRNLSHRIFSQLWAFQVVCFKIKNYNPIHNLAQKSNPKFGSKYFGLLNFPRHRKMVTLHKMDSRRLAATR